MLLLPSSFIANRPSQSALCKALGPYHELARRLDNATMTPLDCSWSDTLRANLNPGADLPLASAYRTTHELRGDTQTIALAKPLAVNLGLTDLSALDDEHVQLGEADSRALCEAANAHLAQEGVTLRFVDAATWFLEIAAHVTPGEGTLDVLTEHPAFIVGENLRQFLPRGRDARGVERWMNELQMLLFNHPVNAERQSKRLPPINFVWLYGFSRADAEAFPISTPPTLFSDALKHGDVPAWQAAWETLAPQIMQADSVILGDSFPRLTLTFQPEKRRLFSWFAKKPTLGEVLMRLHQRAFDASPAGTSP